MHWNVICILPNMMYEHYHRCNLVKMWKRFSRICTQEYNGQIIGFLNVQPCKAVTTSPKGLCKFPPTAHCSSCYLLTSPVLSLITHFHFFLSGECLTIFCWDCHWMLFFNSVRQSLPYNWTFSFFILNVFANLFAIIWFFVIYASLYFV